MERDPLLWLKRTRWVLAQRRTVRLSGFAYWRRSAAVWRRPVLSKIEPPTLVPIKCSKVPPLSGTTPTSNSPALAADWNVCNSGMTATTGVTHAYDSFTSRPSHPTLCTYSGLAYVKNPAFKQLPPPSTRARALGMPSSETKLCDADVGVSSDKSFWKFRSSSTNGFPYGLPAKI